MNEKRKDRRRFQQIVSKQGKSNVHAGLLALLLLCLASCQEKQETTDYQEDYEYFPLEVGKYWVYEVDSVIYSPIGVRRDSTRTFFREEIVEQFIANNGDTIYRVERFKRPAALSAWQFAEVFSLQRNREQAVLTENNVPLVKLVFPLRRPDGWTSTALLDASTSFKVRSETMDVFNFWEGRARIDSVGQPLTVGTLQFPETAKVTYANRTDINTALRIAVERYARGVGLVQRDWQILDGTCDMPPCNAARWRTIASKGFLLSQRLIEHN